MPNIEASSPGQVTPAFYRLCAVMSALSALTTLVLIYAPEWYGPVQKGLAGRVERVNDAAYQLRAWTYLVHPFLVMAGILGLVLRLRRGPIQLLVPGFIGFAAWGMVEAAQQCLTLFAFDRWRRAYAAGDQVVIDAFPQLVAVYDGLWDAAYVLLLIGFLVGNACLGRALLSDGRHLSRALGIALIAAFILTAGLLGIEAGLWTLPGTAITVAYTVLQPAARVLLAVWLWVHAVEGEVGAPRPPLPTPAVGQTGSPAS